MKTPDDAYTRYTTAPDRLDFRELSCSVFVLSTRTTEEMRLCKTQLACEQRQDRYDRIVNQAVAHTLASKKCKTEQTSFHSENIRVMPQRRKKGM